MLLEDGTCRCKHCHQDQLHHRITDDEPPEMSDILLTLPTPTPETELAEPESSNSCVQMPTLSPT